MSKLQTVHVTDLIEQLVALRGAGLERVRVWLPGSTVALGTAFARGDEIHIEGNLDPGSALDGPPPIKPVAKAMADKTPEDAIGMAAVACLETGDYRPEATLRHLRLLGFDVVRVGAADIPSKWTHCQRCGERFVQGGHVCSAVQS